MNSVSISILQPPLNSARTFGSQQFYSKLSQFNLFEALTLMFSDDKSRLNYTRWFFSPYEELAVDRSPPTYIFQNRARWATARHVRDVWQCIKASQHHQTIAYIFSSLITQKSIFPLEHQIPRPSPGPRYLSIFPRSCHRDSRSEYSLILLCQKTWKIIKTTEQLSHIKS